MNHLRIYLRSLFIALVVLALSASLAFGAKPAWSKGSAASSGGATILLGEDEESGDDEGEVDEVEEAEETEEDEEGTEDEAAGEGGDNCATDPTLLTEEELAELRHGSIVCWAAHQTEWPEWFSNHGQFVRCWAHQGKADAPSCTEDPEAVDATGDSVDDEAAADATGAGSGKGNGKGKGSGRGKGHRD